MRKWLTTKQGRICVNLIFWFFCFTLFVCSLTFFIMKVNDNVNEKFEKIWSGILAIITVLNAPLTVLKIHSVYLNVIYTKEKKKQYIINYEKEKMMKDKKLKMIVKNKQFDKNDSKSKIQMYCEIQGKKLVGVTLYEIFNIIDTPDLDDKDKIEKIAFEIKRFGINVDDKQLIKDLSKII